MGSQSHWLGEEKAVHTSYETVVDKTVYATTRRSSLLNSFIRTVPVTGHTPEEIANGAAAFTQYKALMDGSGRNCEWTWAKKKKAAEKSAALKNTR